MAIDVVTLTLAKNYAKKYYEEHSGGSAILVGTVVNDGLFPTKRKDGSNLIIGDFVKPEKDQTYPIKVYYDSTKSTYMEFNSVNDTAVYDGNGGWLYNANPFQKTSETPLADKSKESLSGTAKYQNAVNEELVTEAKKIDGKVDKSTNDTDNLIYTRTAGTEGTQKYNRKAYAGTIAMRDTGGVIKVGDPVADEDATNKKYVDDHVKTYTAGDNVEIDSTNKISSNQIDDSLSTSLDKTWSIDKIKMELSGDVEIISQTPPETGCAATYVLKQGGSELSPKINIPVDRYAKSGKIVTTVDYTTATAYSAGDVIDYMSASYIVEQSISAADNTKFSDVYTSSLGTHFAEGEQLLVLSICDAAGSVVTQYTVVSVDDIRVPVDDAISSTSENPVQNKVIKVELDKKQDNLTAGDNISIDSNNKISATDTTYSAGDNIAISTDNKISATDTTYSAGDNIAIAADNKISATDTTYTAGTSIDIDSNNKINAVVDDALSDTSTNPVENKVIKTALDGEITARSDGDTDLQAKIDAEETARTSTDDNLQDQIDNLSGMGRFLANWDCTTGKPKTDPQSMPYTYKTGDYYIVSAVASGTSKNYKPDGTTYTGAASTVEETDEVKVNDYYTFDGTSWAHISHTQKETTFSSITGDVYDNISAKTALDAKQDTLTAGTSIEITSDDTINALVDDALSTTSTNPVQNKLIKEALDNEAAIREANDDDLEDLIEDLSKQGKLLGNWDCTTGKPVKDPISLPYTYNSGDYYCVSNTGDTNYKPNGTKYDGTASTTVETDTVAINDYYLFDGTTWKHMSNKVIVVDDALSSTSENPVQNKVIATALDIYLPLDGSKNMTGTLKVLGDPPDEITKPSICADASDSMLAICASESWYRGASLYLYPKGNFSYSGGFALECISSWSDPYYLAGYIESDGSSHLIWKKDGSASYEILHTGNLKVSATGTSTDEIKYLTIYDKEYKIGGSSGDYLPLDGGEMTGSIVADSSASPIIKAKTDSDSVILYGGSDSSSSSFILYGKDAPVGAQSRFVLTANNDGASKSLVGTYDGPLLWDGNPVTTTVQKTGGEVLNVNTNNGSLILNYNGNLVAMVCASDESKIIINGVSYVKASSASTVIEAQPTIAGDTVTINYVIADKQYQISTDNSDAIMSALQQ